MAKKKARRIESFELGPGRKIGRRYVVEQLLGAGVEGEVYQIRELDTGIRRAAKLYFPHRNPRHRSSIRHAQKLNVLRHCPIVLQYHHSEQMQIRRQNVICLISELCDGVPLEKWVRKHRGGRLDPFRALNVMYHLVRGIEAIHALGQYHADVHSENILIQPRGVQFNIRLVDFYDWGRPARFKQHQDICDTIQVFYECLGGREHYAKQPPEVRHICAGMKRTLILQRFATMTALRQHLEAFDWQTML